MFFDDAVTVSRELELVLTGKNCGLEERAPMCGICGFTGEVIDRDKVIKNMTDVITHRGPDSDGVFGVEAAAQRYFHKPASKLTRSEAALLAASRCYR